MARTLTRASQVYPARPGDPYGPFSLDSFTKDDTDRIEIELTVEAWPDVPVVARLVVASDNGGGMTVNVPGRPKNRDGTDATVFRCSLGMVADGAVVGGVHQPVVKRNVSTATVTVEVLADVRTAITVRAV